MKITKNKFEVGDYLVDTWSADGGFNRGADIYQVVDKDLKNRTLTLDLYISRSGCDLDINENVEFDLVHKPFKVKFKKVRNEFVTELPAEIIVDPDYKLNNRYLTSRNSICNHPADDVRDNGHEYKIKEK